MWPKNLIVLTGLRVGPLTLSGIIGLFSCHCQTTRDTPFGIDPTTNLQQNRSNIVERSCHISPISLSTLFNVIFYWVNLHISGFYYIFLVLTCFWWGSLVTHLSFISFTLTYDNLTIYLLHTTLALTRDPHHTASTITYSVIIDVLGSQILK